MFAMAGPASAKPWTARHDDGYNAREAPIEPNEQRAVDPTQIQSAWGALLQDIELMPQSQDFGF
jgi:hypothetical protein